MGSTAHVPVLNLITLIEAEEETKIQQTKKRTTIDDDDDDSSSNNNKSNNINNYNSNNQSSSKTMSRYSRGTQKLGEMAWEEERGGDEKTQGENTGEWKEGRRSRRTPEINM